MMQREMIIQKLKESGCRITKQRLMLLDIILEEDCSCCKEIYFKASKVDPKIGVATVYRMVNAMEDIGAIKCMRGFQLAGSGNRSIFIFTLGIEKCLDQKMMQAFLLVCRAWH